MSMPVVLTIAGSDSCGGAGIQADIKTVTAHKLYAESVITALTAQNTLGVQGVMEVPADFIRQQIDSVFADMAPDAVKVGMVPSAAAAQAIADSLVAHHARNIVVDPVMVATSGDTLADEAAVQAIMQCLLPLACVITPNIPEAEVLSGMSIGGKDEMEAAASVIAQHMRQGAVLVKGGHSHGNADDLLLTEHGRVVWLNSRHIDTPNTHGTGCTLSSAIACGLAMGFEVQASVSKAKTYISGALENDPNMGAGNGPLNHVWNLM